MRPRVPTPRRLIARADRHPWMAAAGVVLAAAMTALLAVRLAAPVPAPGDGAGGAYTQAASAATQTWTLADLVEHARAGGVRQITETDAASATGGLVAVTTDGQEIPIALTIGTADAVKALSDMGLGSLLTVDAATTAAQASDTTQRSSNDPDPVSWILLLALTAGMVGLAALAIQRVTRRGMPRPDRGNRAAFTAVMPATGEDARGGVRLDDVAGCEEAKVELVETIEFLKEPERFTRLGATSPRGVLLWGPPGTGKTMLAKAVATEAGVPFIAASGSQFVEKFVGVGASRVRDLFAQARKHGRAVVFIDEFDALAKARGGLNSHEEREQTLNQLLVEMDGFGTTDELVVIGATNRYDTLDPAVLRPGRFTRKIHVGLPDVEARRAILGIHARNKPLTGDVDLEVLARRSAGFSGAELADCLNEAAILAARRDAEALSPADVRDGWLKVAVGTSRARSMDERERAIIAAHEAGHAICGRIWGEKRRVEEISLFAHGEALGVTVSSQEDNDLPSESDLRATLIALMGGRAAEELLFEEITPGASSDFQKADRLATQMVMHWGMGRDPEAEQPGVSGRGSMSFRVVRDDGALPADVSAAMSRAIAAILDDAYAESKRTLLREMVRLRRVAAFLVEHERIDGETFAAVFAGDLLPTADAGDEWRPTSARPRPWDDVAATLIDVPRREPRPLPPPRALAPEPIPVPERRRRPRLASIPAAILRRLIEPGDHGAGAA